MATNERDNYYHGGLGAENRRNWDRSTRDGDYGRDYENRFRSGKDRDREYRRHYRDLEDRYYDSTHRNGPDMSNIRQGYGISSFDDNDARFTDTGEAIAQRMQRDRDRLRRMGGYSGSAFGGSNYSAHGDFSGSSDYGAMSGSGGNVDDYTSMSGYGGDRSNVAHSAGRNASYYNRNNYSRDDYDDFTKRRGISNHSPDNQAGAYSGFGKYGTTGDDAYENRNSYQYERNSRIIDRGGYRNYDPNNRWNS